MLRRIWQDDEGVLTFEWILLLTLLVIGVIGGIAAIRDAAIHESQGVVGAMVSVDQSYSVAPPLGVGVEALTPSGSNCTSSAAYSSFHDSAVYGTGRLTPLQLGSIAQPITGDGALCGLP